MEQCLHTTCCHGESWVLARRPWEINGLGTLNRFSSLTRTSLMESDWVSGHPVLEKFRIWTLRVQDGERLWACLASKAPQAMLCRQDPESAWDLVRCGYASGLMYYICY